MEFDAYVRSRTGAMWRFVYLLCGDRLLGEDVLRTALARAFRNWWWICRTDHPDTHVRRLIVRTHLDRCRWLGDERAPSSGSRGTIVRRPDAVGRGPIWQALTALSPEPRTVLVLRYYQDLSDLRIAGLLSRGPAVVRTHAAAGLASLHDRLLPSAAPIGTASATELERRLRAWLPDLAQAAGDGPDPMTLLVLAERTGEQVRHRQWTMGVSVVAALAMAVTFAASVSWWLGRPDDLVRISTGTRLVDGTPSGSASSSPFGSVAEESPGPNAAGIGDLAGRWDSAAGARVVFSPAGTWITLGGCTTGTGSWRLTAEGAFAAKVSERTRRPCPTVPGASGLPQGLPSGLPTDPPADSRADLPAGDRLLNELEATTRVTKVIESGHPAIALLDATGAEIDRLFQATASSDPTPASAVAATSMPSGSPSQDG